jgi:multisubunit Na+/H+ antiporter MnhB subunit
LDGLLALALVVLADMALRQRRTSESVVQFMVFGLVTSFAWVRVDAPDLALTEAAIGSGVTGALLLAALRRIGHEAPVSGYVRRGVRVPVELGCVALGGVLSWCLWTAWPDTPGLAERAHQSLPLTGVTNPVTAVILNYRAWDTLLEMAVLWVAALSVYALRDRIRTVQGDGASSVFRFYLSRMAPLFCLVVVYMVWVGSRAPGGAFPAGALLGGLGVLFLLGPQPPRLPIRSGKIRLLLALGTAVFAGVAAAMLTGGALLQYPPDQAKGWILFIEFGCTLSIGLSFTVLFAGCAGRLASEEP